MFTDECVAFLCYHRHIVLYAYVCYKYAFNSTSTDTYMEWRIKSSKHGISYVCMAYPGFSDKGVSEDWCRSHKHDNNRASYEAHTTSNSHCLLSKFTQKYNLQYKKGSVLHKYNAILSHQIEMTNVIASTM